MEYLTSAIVLAATLTASAVENTEYKPVPSQFPMSRWAKEVSPENALPEYPRPMMVRKDWINLNGLWDYTVQARESKNPDSYQGKLLVPYCIESPLSGVGKMITTFPGRNYDNTRIWYRRSFETPVKWSGNRILLHFGAVDWEATVHVNGKDLGTHKGGYDSFSFDITDALNKKGDNELVVSVWDPTSQYPRGKQTIRPGGIFYTPCSGIWQTVWLEPVAATSIKNLVMVPDIDKKTLQLTVATRGDSSNVEVHATVLDAGKTVAKATGKPNEPIEITITNPKLWWPDEPFLYDLKVELTKKRGLSKFLGGKRVDSIESYFGMRKISLAQDEKSITRMMLNNKFIVHNGLLDQGFWPGGIYTAPTDEALRYDIEATKKLGFNMSRKHLKTEPQRWYYWADKLGLLVWQDMPSGGSGETPEIREQFMHELDRMIDERFNHPSIVSWVLFNEGMGLRGFDLKAVTAKAIKMDTTRLINHESGAGGGGNQGKNKFDVGAGHIIDFHCYGTTRAPVPEPDRAGVVGEYGYSKYLSTCGKYAPLVKDPGISGLVWTQTTNVEKERNGLMTYDRAKFTEDAEKIASENEKYYIEFMKH